jgi:hypothetical protein
MKPIRFVCGEPSPRFGVVVGACAVALAALRTASGKSYAQLADSRTNLANLPDSEAAARDRATQILRDNP